MMNVRRTGSAGQGAARTSSLWIVLIAGSAVLGIVLRLDGIGSSLWLDEFGTLWTVEESLTTAWKRAITFQGQTPFYYTFVWVSLRLFGESEVAIRLPSLVFGLMAWAVLALGALKLFGRRAGGFAFLVAAVDPTLVHASADGRPYALAFLMLTLTIVGFILSCQNGGSGRRLMWVAAGAGTMWAHYVFYPFVLGIVSAYFVIRSCRDRYPASRFRRDLLLHIGLAALALPQLVQLFARREMLDWVSTGYTGGGLIQNTLPYWLPLVLGALATRNSEKPIRDYLRILWVCALVGTLAFLSLNILGANILHWRYMQGGLTAVVLISAGAFAISNQFKAAFIVLVTTSLLATVLQVLQRSYGTFTQLGFEGWRQATEILDAALAEDSQTPVLFRSGFIEEDQLPLGSPVPATRAPLRSPGREAPAWNIVSLTSTWDHPEREAYFADEVLPQLDSEEMFYLLSRSRAYAAQVADWIAVERPGVFTTQTQKFGQVVLITFHRTPNATVVRE